MELSITSHYLQNCSFQHQEWTQLLSPHGQEALRALRKGSLNICSSTTAPSAHEDYVMWQKPPEQLLYEPCGEVILSTSTHWFMRSINIYSLLLFAQAQAYTLRLDFHSNKTTLVSYTVHIVAARISCAKTELWFSQTGEGNIVFIGLFMETETLNNRVSKVHINSLTWTQP